MDLEPQQNSNKTLLVSAIIVLALGLMGWYLVTHKKPVETPSDGTPTISIDSPREKKKETIKEEEAYYSINADYPETENGRINDVFKSFVAEQIREFKQDTGVENMDSKMAADLGLNPDRKYSLSIGYESVFSMDAYNYIFQINTDTGGAHPNQFYTTFSFDSVGAEIKLSNIFKPDTKYLEAIAKVVQEELMKREFADADWIKEGAGPNEENYRNFIVRDGELEFIFDPYQVAPYAAGVQHVTVPLSSLGAIVRPEFAN